MLGVGMRLTLIMVNPDGVREGPRNLTMGMSNVTGVEGGEAQARRLLEVEEEVELTVARKGRRRRERED